MGEIGYELRVNDSGDTLSIIIPTTGPGIEPDELTNDEL